MVADKVIRNEILTSFAEVVQELGGDLECLVLQAGLDPALFRQMDGTMPLHVRQAIGQALAEAECTREHVAASLGLHPRTLQRRLREIGQSFEGLRDGVRRNLAVRYLARSDLPLNEIVDRLGYSEPAVFSRSCRRWFARTPSELRRSLSR